MLRLYTDYRLGGNPRYYVATEEESAVRIPIKLRKSVAFVLYRNKEKNGRLSYAGTAFFMHDEII